VHSPHAEMAIDFLNMLVTESPVLEFNLLKMIKLPEIKDFKYPDPNTLKIKYEEKK
jgi:hypothetical protein